MTRLGPWLAELGGALLGEHDMEVPCGTCTACCTSSQFVHVGPEDVDARRRIPAELLFPAPGLPDGHLVMGHDERGHCPMLVGGGCSIYDARPRACRTYDCRVFTVAAVEPTGWPDIAAQARSWVLDVDDEDAELLDRIRADVEPEVVRPLDRALRAVGPVAVELARRPRGGSV